MLDTNIKIGGGTQPHNSQLEEVVLGAIILDSTALTTVIDILSPESFYVDAHKEIYKAMLRLSENSAPVDLMTLLEELKKGGSLQKVGGASYLVELTNRIASAANIEYHARLLSQKFIQRELIRVSTKVIGDANDETIDVFNLLSETEQAVFSINQNNISKGSMSIVDLTSKALKQLEDMASRGTGLTGVPTGFTDLDRLTSGWQPSDLIIMAARPGMGKSALILAMARNAAVDFHKGVAIFSLEMSSNQLVQRLMSMEAEISGSKLRNGQLEDYEWEKLQNTVEVISSAPLYIDDTAGISITELRAKCRRLKTQHNIELVIIDYLQLMTGNKDNKKNREQEIGSISRALKALAKELNVPVIALSQLNRAVETRGGNKRPMLSDLRESGSIEQDADIVSFIYRPEYYGITEDEEGSSLKGIGEVILAKHRNGALDTVKLKFTDQYAKFGNLDDPDMAYSYREPLKHFAEKDADIPF